MKIKHGIKILMAVVAVLFLVFSCSYFNEETNTPTEQSKSIVGSWKIVKAYRNDVDITDMMDFTKFRVNFKEDASYTIDNYLPFIVSKNGKYSLDDPQYPFHILFTQDGDAQELQTNLSFPVVDAERQIGLTFSPGCINNTYTYILKRESVN